MAGLNKLYYPATDTTALTITLTSLAASSTLLVGRQSTAQSNVSNLDEDITVSGRIKVGASGVAAGRVEVWAYFARKVVSGTPSYPSPITGSDAGATFGSSNVKNCALRPLWSALIAATNDIVYEMPPTLVNGPTGVLVPYWGIFVTHSSTAALSSTAADHEFHFRRVHRQYT